MQELVKTKGKGAFLVNNWQEIRKSGGESPPPEQITAYLRGSTDRRLTRDDLIQRIDSYFMSCIRQYVDEETGETGFSWKKNPTKSELAMCIGVSSATLSRYLAGRHDGIEYSGLDPGRRGVVSPSDFDVIQAASTVIESFYESRLGINMNNAGSIFWLKNRDNSNWHDSVDMNLSANANQEREQLSREEIAARYAQFKELPEKPELD